MDDVAKLQVLVPALAFLLAAVFGAVAQRVNFCTMGAVTDIANFGDWRRMRMWLLAIATAIAGTALLTSAGLIDVAKTFYTTAQVPWLSNLVGGFLFGFGMTLSSGCGSKTLLRVGAGNMKSLIVLIFLGLSAYMTLQGRVGAAACERARSACASTSRAFGATSSDLGIARRRAGSGRCGEAVDPVRRSRWRSAHSCSRAASSARRGRCSSAAC